MTRSLWNNIANYTDNNHVCYKYKDVEVLCDVLQLDKITAIGCSRILDKNTPPSEFLPDSNTEYTSGDTRIFSQLHPPLLMNEHKHPLGIKNPKFQCFF